MKWTAEHSAALRRGWLDGQSDEDLAAVLGATVAAIRTKRVDLRLIPERRRHFEMMDGGRSPSGQEAVRRNVDQNGYVVLERTEFRVVALYDTSTGERRVITFCHDTGDVRRARGDAVDARHGTLKDVRVERFQRAGAHENWVAVREVAAE